MKERCRGTFRVGFVGAGYIADWHAQALRSVPCATLAAVCDRDPGRARALAERTRVQNVFESLAAMLAAGGLDAVHVLVPPEHHHAVASRVIEAGLHVLLEKPMATSAEECNALIAEADRRGVRIGVGHNFLFSEPYERLKVDLKAGRLGQPDQITIAWNRGLDQLRSGPFDLWMLREPEHILLEIGPHSVAHLLDLVETAEIVAVRASNPVELPGGRRFYRRWRVEAEAGPTGATLAFSFAPGFAEHTIHVRGSLAAATADLERNTYTLRRHSTYGPDFDRYRSLTDEAHGLRAQARRGLARYGLSVLKLSDKGKPYGVSIARALQAFYGALPGPPDGRFRGFPRNPPLRAGDMILRREPFAGLGLGATSIKGHTPPDPRISAGMGREVVRLCTEIGRLAQVHRDEPASRQPGPVPAAVPGARPEILILGATGFIGRELARQLLAQGCAVRALVRSPGRLPPDLQTLAMDVIQGDAACDEDVERALDGVSCVYHLARANAKTWDEYYRQDVQVTERIAAACLRRGVRRLIYTGSIASYYLGKHAGMITEQTPLDPRICRSNNYARSKAVSEGILLALHRERGLPVVIFRPGIVLGRGGSPYHWGIGMWSYDAVCQIWGNGNHALPTVLVEDVARALVLARDAEGIDGEAFNLAGEPVLSARKYLEELERCAGVEFRKLPTAPWKFYVADMGKWLVKQLVRHPERRRPSYREWGSRTHHARFDCSKAARMLGWEPTRSREEIIRRGIQVPAAEFLAGAASELCK